MIFIVRYRPRRSKALTPEVLEIACYFETNEVSYLEIGHFSFSITFFVRSSHLKNPIHILISEFHLRANTCIVLFEIYRKILFTRFVTAKKCCHMGFILCIRIYIANAIDRIVVLL